MPDQQSLDLHANAWRFLADPGRFASESALDNSSLRRQFRSAMTILNRLNGSCGESPRGGVLLADDAGLGKTLVAAMVAWVVARANRAEGALGKVRILAPNDRVADHWFDELRIHIKTLRTLAPSLGVSESQLRGEAQNLGDGQIKITTHRRSIESSLDCSLLIVDEAHKAKSTFSNFHEHLRSRQKQYRKVLFLTATPFSIKARELSDVLRLAGAGDGLSPETYMNAIDELDRKDGTVDPKQVADDLVERAEATLKGLSYWMIRHGIGSLSKREIDAVGHEAEAGSLQGDRLQATDTDLAILVRADRALRLSPRPKSNKSLDPQFHVGLAQLSLELKGAIKRAEKHESREEVRLHVARIRKLLPPGSVHPKIRAVGRLVHRIVEGADGKGHEKVLVFCRHLAVADELGRHLAGVLGERPVCTLQHLREALERVLPPALLESDKSMRGQFINWMLRAGPRAQIGSWLEEANPGSAEDLVSQLHEHPVRRVPGAPSIAEAMCAELDRLRAAKSRDAGDDDEEGTENLLFEPLARALCQRDWRSIPGANDRRMTMAIHDGATINAAKNESVARRVFNSPFGPDVLIATDALSEGVDLHRYCRILVHYELDSSPIRIVQRNGRIRRLGSWAASLDPPGEVEYHYPTFLGTRDERLVRAIRHRLSRFDLLLGHVGGQIKDENLARAGSEWRDRVLDLCRARIAKLNEKLLGTG